MHGGYQSTFNPRNHLSEPNTRRFTEQNLKCQEEAALSVHSSHCNVRSFYTHPEFSFLVIGRSLVCGEIFSGSQRTSVAYAGYSG